MTLIPTFEYLEKNTRELETAFSESKNRANGVYNDDWFVLSLQLNKLSVNMDQTRSDLLDMESFETNSSSTTTYRNRLKMLNSRLNELTFQVKRQQEREKEESERRTRLERAAAAKTQIDPEIRSQLKNRKPSESHSLSVEEKLSIEKSTQDSISSELLSMVSAIKQNAVKFGEKMAQDEHVLGDTSDALYQTSTNMDKVGNRLSKYRSSTAIGWWFYIWSVLFLVISVVAGMIVIRLFPKW